MAEVIQKSDRSDTKPESPDLSGNQVLLLFEQQLRCAVYEGDQACAVALRDTINAALVLGIAGRVLTAMDEFNTVSGKAVNGNAGTISHYAGTGKSETQLLFRKLRSEILEQVANSTTSPLYAAV